jgi:hypothetical protein
LEELVLAMTVTYPLTRISLDDLNEHDFSSSTRQAIFRAMKTARNEAGEELARTLTDLSKDINILLLVGERQYAELEPAGRSIEAFELVRRLQTEANKSHKDKLTKRLREAQESGDVQLELSLLGQLQAINEQEN